MNERKAELLKRAAMRYGRLAAALALEAALHEDNKPIASAMEAHHDVMVAMALAEDAYGEAISLEHKMWKEAMKDLKGAPEDPEVQPQHAVAA